MSSVWETRYRLLMEHLETLANQLNDKEQAEPEEQIGNVVLLRYLT